ncbi:43876_t:CDS:2, partial [Gigaspora margarita]
MSISSNNSKLDKDPFNELGFNNVEEAVKVTPFVYFMTFIIAIGGFMYGYNSGVISGAMLLLEKDIPMSGFQKGLVVGAMLFGAMVSGIFAGILSDCIGRRVTLLLAAIIFANGSIILAFTTLLSKNISPIIILVMGRLIVGIAIGLVSMVVPVYIGEISPTFYRGKLVTINILMVTGEIDDIHDTISQDTSGSYKQLIRYPNLRPLIIACSLQAIQNLSGFSVTMFYGAIIMKMIGFNSAKLDITSSIIITGTNFLSTGSCIEYGANCEACLIDDRCRFIMSGTSGTCIQNSDILSEDQSLNTCQSTNAQGAWLTLLGLFLYVIGIGNVPWTIQGELFPLNIRGRAAGIST